MENVIKNDVFEYLKRLPKKVQNLALDGTWQDKTVEIGKKYSLNDSQIDNLVDSVLLVLVGLEKPETFLQTLVKDLSISQLLAEQIMKELENRVFDYALKQIENTKTPEIDTRPTVVDKKIESVSRVPEIKPNNLPTQQIITPSQTKPPVQPAPKLNPFPKPNFLTTQNKPLSTPTAPEVKSEIKNVVPEKSMSNSGAVVPKLTPIPSYKPTSQVEEKSEKQLKTEEDEVSGGGRINYTSKTLEPVQQPIPVPRFTGTPIPEEKMDSEIVKNDVPKSTMMDDKLTKVTPGLSDTKTLKNETSEVKPMKSYTLDPYREPLE